MSPGSRQRVEDSRRGVGPRDQATNDWRQRYETLLLANARLTEELQRQEAAHRRALTVVKYASSLPNNDVFTKQLVDENRQLLQRFRALELRFAKLNGNSAPSSPRRSIDRTRRSVKTLGLPLKNASVQATDGDESPAQDKVASEQGEEKSKKKAEGRIPKEVKSLIDMLKQRLSELDLDLSRLKHENELLRSERSSEENDASKSNLVQYEELREQLRTKEEQQELEHLIRDRMRQMQILEEQFSHLQNKMKTKTLLYNESVSKIEELTKELFDAKQTLLQQAEWLHAQEDTKLQLSVLEKEVHVLRSENATLNEAVSVLSARPLDALSAKLESKALEISLLDDQNAKLEGELQKARQDHRIVMQTNAKLRARVEELTKQLESPLAEIEVLKAQKEQCATERDVAQLQLQFYLSGETIESQELLEAVGKALKQMRSQPSQVGAKVPVTAERALCPKCQGGGGRGGSGSILQQERIEKIVEATKLIQEDLRAELRDARVVHQAEVAQLKRKCAKWEQRANEYVAKIATLQREIKPTQPHQFLSHKTPPVKVGSGTPNEVRNQLVSPDHVDQNLLEVRLFDLRLTALGLREAASFVLFCDYFDFESQHSPVFALSRDATDAAPIEMEVSYRLILDQAFCRSPLAHALVIELHRLGVANSTVVGIAEVSLISTFLSDQGHATMSIRVLDPTTRVAIGLLRVTSILAHPVSELFRAWHVTLDPKFRTLAHTDVNSPVDPILLSVRVVAFVLARSSAPNKTGQINVRYRFMGHPLVRQSSQHVYEGHGYSVFVVDRERSFEIPHDEHILDFLERYELIVSAWDSSEQRGQASVPLKTIVSGLREYTHSCSVEAATLQSRETEVNRHRKAIGRVWLEVQAYDPTLPEQLEARNVRMPIMRTFGSGNQVNWKHFCEAMQLTATERAARQIVWEKSQLRTGSLNSLISLLRSPPSFEDFSLVALMDQSGVRLSRSELSFVSGSLRLDCGEEASDHAVRYLQIQQLLQRFLLVLSTVDSEWIRLEAALRVHVETYKLVTQLQNGDSVLIDWETFVHRVRLLE